MKRQLALKFSLISKTSQGELQVSTWFIPTVEEVISMNTKQSRSLALLIILVIAIGIPVILILNNQQPDSDLEPPNLELTKIGQIDTGGSTEYVKVVGNIAFVIDRNEPTPGGLVLINITDPANPSELSSFHDGGRPQKLDVVGNIVYVADASEGLEIIDVSDTTNPVEIAQYDGSGEIYDVQVIDDIAYVADWINGLVILNVSEPSDPSYMSRYPISGACPHLHVEGDLAYVINHLSANSGFVVVNISDPLDPVFAGGYMPDDVDLWNPFVLGDFMYACNHGAGTGEVQILNITDPWQVSQIGLYDANGTSFAAHVDGSIAFVADAQKGLLVVDVSNPLDPELLCSFYDGGAAVNLDVVGDMVYVADRDGGLEIFQLTS